MTLYKDTYRVESTRLKDWDYSTPGDYYVTILTQNRLNLFGSISDGVLLPSIPAEIAKNCWLSLESRYKNIKLFDFVFMTDHMHGMISIVTKTDATLSAMVGAFKSISTIEINKSQNTPGNIVWYERFYDRIVRSDVEFYFVSEYIKNNPLKNEPAMKELEWFDLMQEREKREKNP